MNLDVRIDPDDPRAPDVAALLQAHQEFARSTTPAEYVFALDVDRLAGPDIRFYSARRDGELLAVGALRHIDDDTVELKSMHTARAARGQGVGRALLERLLAEARAAGYRRVNLDTGTHEGFEPARALYRSVGFETCPPYGGYPPSAHNVFMTLRLD